MTVGEPWAIVRTLLFAGWVPWTRQRFDEAEKIWQRALDMVDPKDYWARVRALTALSINRSEMSDLEGALELIDQASKIAEEAGDQFSVGNTAIQKARVFGDLGRGEESLPWFDRGVAIFADLGARWELADARAARQSGSSTRSLRCRTQPSAGWDESGRSSRSPSLRSRDSSPELGAARFQPECARLPRVRLRPRPTLCGGATRCPALLRS